VSNGNLIEFEFDKKRESSNALLKTTPSIFPLPTTLRLVTFIGNPFKKKSTTNLGVVDVFASQISSFSQLEKTKQRARISIFIFLIFSKLNFNCKVVNGTILFSKKRKIMYVFS
jgi:hypothetical protein